MKSVKFASCAFDPGLDGKRPTREWTVQTTSERLLRELGSKKCIHEEGFHDSQKGSTTNKTGTHGMSIAICLVSTLLPGSILDQVPAFPVMPFHLDPHRARLQDYHTPNGCVLATIHKLLTREEMWNDPEAIQAIWEEGQGVRAKEVWDDATVMEKARLKAAQRAGVTIHIAELMALPPLNFVKLPPNTNIREG